MNRRPTFFAMAAIISLPSLACTTEEEAPPAAEVRDCNQFQELPCYEYVWVDGEARKMSFYDLDVDTDSPDGAFYVVASQSDAAQGIIPFDHDHVIATDDGQYWHGYFVVCTEEGATTGACTFVVGPEDAPPLAQSVRGERLRTIAAIEAAADDGLVLLVDTDAVLQGFVDP